MFKRKKLDYIYNKFLNYDEHLAIAAKFSAYDTDTDNKFFYTGVIPVVFEDISFYGDVSIESDTIIIKSPNNCLKKFIFNYKDKNGKIDHFWFDLPYSNHPYEALHIKTIVPKSGILVLPGQLLFTYENKVCKSYLHNALNKAHSNIISYKDYINFDNYCVWLKKQKLTNIGTGEVKSYNKLKESNQLYYTMDGKFDCHTFHANWLKPLTNNIKRKNND